MALSVSPNSEGTDGRCGRASIGDQLAFRTVIRIGRYFNWNTNVVDGNVCGCACGRPYGHSNKVLENDASESSYGAFLMHSHSDPQPRLSPKFSVQQNAPLEDHKK